MMFLAVLFYFFQSIFFPMLNCFGALIEPDSIVPSFTDDTIVEVRQPLLGPLDPYTLLNLKASSRIFTNGLNDYFLFISEKRCQQSKKMQEFLAIGRYDICFIKENRLVECQKKNGYRIIQVNIRI